MPNSGSSGARPAPHTEAEQINRAVGTVQPPQVQPASSDARTDGTVDFTVRATHASPDR